MLDVYATSPTTSCVPVVRGIKSGASVAGALETQTIEGMMQDGKALQMGASHDLGQNSARPSTSLSRTQAASASTSGRRPGA